MIPKSPPICTPAPLLLIGLYLDLAESKHVLVGPQINLSIHQSGSSIDALSYFILRQYLEFVTGFYDYYNAVS
jgi:hypothetical protein